MYLIIPFKAEAEREAEEDDERKGERYFFTQSATTSTTTTTTTQTPPDGSSCWKCDQMTYANCAAEGDIELCQKGDKDCCFVEVTFYQNFSYIFCDLRIDKN